MAEHQLLLYGFGDSLIAGHELKIGLLDDYAAQAHLTLQNFAVNGASMIPPKPSDHTWASENHIPDLAKQLAQAPAVLPDLIVFDGTTNDAINYVDQQYPLGAPAVDYQPANFDLTTYAGHFENVLALMQAKYPFVPRYFVAVHHMPAIPLARQDRVQALAAQLCHKWSIPVIDLYGAGQINTFDTKMAARFSYNSGSHPQDGNGTHLNVAGYQRFYTPMLQAQIQLPPRH
ncbi:SGNH/GDSL hydrolase family protein [Lapidilactobacillus luobeiensis]|uniref:SGNH/GDSL hydrolase family protein n=1 Tax=Lapidilactobacillus luobeiensis TaxID=2950371 RepID=UPI0021C4215C|nr:SGNH/GDSL hydrolase family protein [Lapidilactobacillus luobeiensis]